MHPHSINRYLNHPNYSVLAKKYPFLTPFVRVDRNGRGHYDFNNRAALWALTRASIQEDFGLDVLIPDDALVPTINLRLKYILWIESLLKVAYKQPDDPCVVVKPINVDHAHVVEQSAKAEASIHPSASISDLGAPTTRTIKGLDIGTGSSATFMLLGAKMNSWEMLGCDTKAESIAFAQSNIDRNGLEERAKVQLTDGTSFFGCFLDKDPSIFLDFTICSPPCFIVRIEGSSTELVRDVGEVEFITKMVKESRKYANRVRIFSTMIHVKRHLIEVMEVVRSEGVELLRTTVFKEGDAEYWCIVWSFLHWPIKPPLAKVRLPIRSIKLPVQAQVLYSLSSLDSQRVLFTFYKKCLAELGFKFISNGEFDFEVICEKNTWSSQSGIGGGQKRQLEGATECSLKQEDPVEKLPRIESPNEGAEEADAAGSAAVPIPTCVEIFSIRQVESLVQYCTLADYIGKEYGLHFRVSRQVDKEERFKIEFNFYSGNFGKDGLRQVKEYLQTKVNSYQFEVHP